MKPPYLYLLHEVALLIQMISLHLLHPHLFLLVILLVAISYLRVSFGVQELVMPAHHISLSSSATQYL